MTCLPNTGALLEDPRAEGRRPDHADSGIRTRRLADVAQHLLRVGCSRCGWTFENQKADAVRLYGPDAIWRDVSQRLLDNTCTQRTRRHEEDCVSAWNNLLHAETQSKTWRLSPLWSSTTGVAMSDSKLQLTREMGRRTDRSS
jgi:rubredoxin